MTKDKTVRKENKKEPKAKEGGKKVPRYLRESATVATTTSKGK
jgi:hypothetical protein